MSNTSSFWAILICAMFNCFLYLLDKCIDFSLSFQTHNNILLQNKSIQSSNDTWNVFYRISKQCVYYITFEIMSTRIQSILYYFSDIHVISIRHEEIGNTCVCNWENWQFHNCKSVSTTTIAWVWCRATDEGVLPETIV